MTRLVAGQAAAGAAQGAILSPILSSCGARRLLVSTKFFTTLRQIQGGKAASRLGAPQAPQRECVVYWYSIQ